MSCSYFSRQSPWGSFVLLLFSLLSRVIADGLNPIEQPAAGSVIPVDEPYTIVWEPGTPGPVSIKIEVNSNGAVQNVTDSTPNSGSYVWTPAPVLALYNNGENYFLQICDVNTGDCTYTFDGRISFSGAATTTTSSSAASFSTATTSVTSSSASSTPTTATTTSTSSPTATSSPSPSPAAGGLSDSAKVAIGVVVSVIGTAAILIGAYFILRARRKRNSSQIPVNEGLYGPKKAELAGWTRYSGGHGFGNKREKGAGGNVYELADGMPPTPELPH